MARTETLEARRRLLLEHNHPSWLRSILSSCGSHHDETMIIVSSILEYVAIALRGKQGATSRHSNVDNGQDPGATYELVDDAGKDPRLTVTGPPGVNTTVLAGNVATDGRTRTGSSTPQTGEEKEAGRESFAENKKRRGHKYKVLFGLALPFALQSLDTTIIASALPFIAADFGMPTSHPADASNSNRRR